MRLSAQVHRVTVDIQEDLELLVPYTIHPPRKVNTPGFGVATGLSLECYAKHFVFYDQSTTYDLLFIF